MHALEKALCKAAKIKQEEDEDRQVFLKRLVETVQELEQDQWDSIPTPAQEWQVEGAKALMKDKPVKDFPSAKAKAPEPEDEEEEETTDESGDDSETEDEAEDEEEGEADEEESEDESEDESPDEDEEESDVEEEEEATTKKKAAKPAKAKAEKTAKPAKAAKPEKKAKTNGAAKSEKKVAKPAKERKQRAPGAQQMIKKLLIKKIDMSVEELNDKLKAAGYKVSTQSVSSIRSGFRDACRILKENGWPKVAI